MEEKHSEQLAAMSKEIENEISRSTGEVVSSGEVSSSRGESAPQPFKKSIADMEEHQHPNISMKEFKALKRSNYDKISDKFQYAYILQNKKNGMVVEIRAASSVHACNIIGWRPKNTKLIEVIDTKKKVNAEDVTDVTNEEIFTNTPSVEKV